MSYYYIRAKVLHVHNLSITGYRLQVVEDRGRVAACTGAGHSSSSSSKSEDQGSGRLGKRFGTRARKPLACFRCARLVEAGPVYPTFSEFCRNPGFCCFCRKFSESVEDTGASLALPVAVGVSRGFSENCCCKVVHFFSFSRERYRCIWPRLSARAWAGVKTAILPRPRRPG